MILYHISDGTLSWSLVGEIACLPAYKLLKLDRVGSFPI